MAARFEHPEDGGVLARVTFSGVGPNLSRREARRLGRAAGMPGLLTWILPPVYVRTMLRIPGVRTGAGSVGLPRAWPTLWARWARWCIARATGRPAVLVGRGESRRVELPARRAGRRRLDRPI